MPHYVYQPLDRDRKETLLLELLPRSGIDNLLRCHLKHISLISDDPAIYETISYCWGDSKQCCYVMVDGYTLEVPVSAEKALRRVRLGNDSSVLWIDSLCINQQDITERGQQVRLMQDIYSGTKLNLVYLGEGGDLAQPAYESLLLIRQQIEFETSNYANLKTVLYDEQMVMRQSSTVLPEGISYRALSALFSESWFTRLWVLQEATLAPDSLCHWGELELDLTSVLRATVWLRYKYLGTEDCVMELSHSFFQAACFLHFLVDPNFGERTQRKWQHIDLRSIHDYSTWFRATDARDYVFGMLGLRNTPSSDAVLNLVEIDYTKPISDVFRDATRASIEERGNLGILRDAEDDRTHNCDGRIDTPSWVASWGRSRDWRVDSTPMGMSYRADDHRRFDYSRSLEHQRILRLGGLVLDKITALSAICNVTEAQRFGDFLEEYINSVTNRLDPAARPRNTEDLGPTLVAGFDMARHAVGREGFRDLLALKTFLQQKREWPPSWAIRGKCLDVDMIRLYDYAGALRPTIRHRRIFVTQSGYVGVGPKHARAGDVVAVIYGGVWPFILRSMGSEYSMIGTCYVHGIMNGEAVREHEAEGKEDVVFDII
ncbi:hypothetical protein LTR86_001305 [Recurvomyces mirabilis]|nr:hypothetical protein LTR86_001305 [Recurvomyces mirabilis]